MVARKIVTIKNRVLLHKILELKFGKIEIWIL